MGHYSFKADLKSAQEKELELAQLLYRRGKVCSIDTNHDKRFDLDVVLKNGKSCTIEVKHDMMHTKTGNIGVEFHSWQKPSGIAVTEATYWCFALHDGFWIVATDKLKQMIADKKYFRIATGGDAGSDTQMYLFKGDWLKKRMTQILTI
jgi:hypothetical protein